ncbi:MAG: PKD domain-containing protein [Crocinitomicaceae bacterium]|nr:PKD domain-containing protein [Crocinitomicaceae bacterium]
MKKNYLSVLSMALIGFSYAQDSANVLFIGNSYTYVNDLPNLIRDLAASQGDFFESLSQTPGGTTFNNHASNPATYTAINTDDWDYVVLQAQSQEPSFSDSQVNSETLPYAIQLADSVYANNECTDVLMFMTWGRENGDPQWGPISTFDGMNGRLRLAYMRMADSVEASVSPVGSAWKYVRDNNPAIGLYAGDGSHPSIYGSYLAACVFYASIYRKTPVGAPFISTISQADADVLQAAAAITVLDSLDQWDLHGVTEHTQADFTYVVNGPDVTFTNESVRASSYSWDFEDGQNSTDENPTITYSGNGTYMVTLISESACDSDTIQFDITITEASIAENQDLGLSYAKVSPGVFEVIGTSNIDLITVLDASGRLVSQSTSTMIDLSKEPSGMYLINIQLEDKIQRIRVLK